MAHPHLNSGSLYLSFCSCCSLGFACMELLTKLAPPQIGSEAVAIPEVVIVIASPEFYLCHIASVNYCTIKLQAF
jgi:hypothetical protein